MNTFKVGDRVWWIEPSSFNANLYGYRGKRMTGTIRDFSPKGATAWVQLDESSKGRNSCPFGWGEPHVNILNELETTVDPFVRAVGTKVDIPHGNGWSTSYLGWTIKSNSGMYYADIKFGVVRYQSDNLDDIMNKIKGRVMHQGYGVHWKRLQDELCANYNKERIERGAELKMEYLGYKVYGKDDWWFACNDEHEYEIKPSRRELVSAITCKEAWREDA